MTLINKATSQTVTLTASGPGANLLVGAQGSIIISAAGDAGVASNHAGAAITNFGTITAGIGPEVTTTTKGNPPGGAGIQVTAATTVTNHGLIQGGAGAAPLSNRPPTGGDGVVGNTITLINTATIDGGAGGVTLGKLVGAGGAGIDIGTHSAAINHGTISGGTGHLGNAGSVTHGGYGAILGTLSTLTNTGVITGGDGGTGSTGVLVNGGTLSNSGTIFAGFGGGHAGLLLQSGASAHNSGLITGGSQVPGVSSQTKFGYFGSEGVGITGGASLANTGTISGGAGGAGYYIGNIGEQPIFPGTGGTGVNLGAGNLVNAGHIIGGTGGFEAGTVYVGTGGAGVIIAGGTVTNTGTITGGTGGLGYFVSGTGGAGVQINGGTLVTSGTISGGAGGPAYVAPGGTITGTVGAAGAAVTFGTLASTLVINGNASFNGAVTGNGANDTLDIVAAHPTTLTGLGTQFTGFTTIGVQAASLLTLTDSPILGAGTTLTDNGHLTVDGAVSGAGALLIANFGTLTLDAGFSAGALAFEAAGTLALAAPDSVTTAISGFGAGDTVDLRKIKLTGLNDANNTLTLLNHGSVAATLAFAGTYTAANFTLAADGQGGTDITFTPNAVSPAWDHPAAPEASPYLTLHGEHGAIPPPLLPPHFTG